MDDPIEEQMIVEVKALIQIEVALNLLNLSDRLLDLKELTVGLQSVLGTLNNRFDESTIR